MSGMRKYTSPELSRVVLDATQALLATCLMGGGYFSTTVASNRCLGAGGTPGECDIAARKGTGSGNITSYETDTPPS